MHRFQELQAFVAVVETGSFTAAAERLDTAKSAVSRRVSALEERLGVQLIRRTTRKLNLTDTGQSFYEHSARILADLDEAESAVLQQHGELRGTLRVALPMSFALRHMSEPVAEFSRRHPRVKFDFDLNDRRVDLLQDGMDLALRIGRLQDSTLIARRLFDVRAIVCASPTYIEQHGIPETPDDLVSHRCLVYSNVPDPGRWTYRDAASAQHVVDVNATMLASSGDFLGEAAVNGQGIVLQPTFIAGDRIHSGELVRILEDYEWPIAPAYVVYPPTRHLSYRVREFIDFLAEYFSGALSWDEECDRSTAGAARGR
jgi:DNA-binding transcriptional LysR family regulator